MTDEALEKLLVLPSNYTLFSSPNPPEEPELRYAKKIEGAIGWRGVGDDAIAYIWRQVEDIELGIVGHWHMTDEYCRLLFKRKKCRRLLFERRIVEDIKKFYGEVEGIDLNSSATEE